MELRTAPTLLLDEERCRANIAAMADRAGHLGLRLRPHFKSHQSRTVGDWLREAGVRGITVSSLDMARYFVRAGWRNVTIAFPANPGWAGELDALAGTARVGCLVESVEVVRVLEASLSRRLDAWIKVDTGYGRTGIDPADLDRLDELVEGLLGSSRLRIQGFLTHAGHTYQAGSVQEIRRIHSDSVASMAVLKQRYRSGVKGVQVSIGDTPGCRLGAAWEGVDEIRPGNYVFLDLMQVRLGVCEPGEIALALACPVAAVHPDRGRVLLHGGAVHLSKESLNGPDGRPMYGSVVEFREDGWSRPRPEARVVSLSQEHGLAVLPLDWLRRLSPGDVLGVLPVHSCLTAQCMGGYRTLQGDRVDHRLDPSADS